MIVMTNLDISHFPQLLHQLLLPRLVANRITYLLQPGPRIPAVHRKPGRMRRQLLLLHRQIEELLRHGECFRQTPRRDGVVGDVDEPDVSARIDQSVRDGFLVGRARIRLDEGREIDDGDLRRGRRYHGCFWSAWRRLFNLQARN